MDRFPTDQYSNSSLWTSASDANAALNGVYSKWENGIYAEGWLFRMDEASDNAVCPYSWESYSMLGNQLLLTPTNTGAGKWEYNTIQKCNWFLANIDKTPMDENLKKRMIAEAKFLRAYKYFIMSQLYGGVPLITKNVTIAEANSIPRTSKDSVLNFVLDELNAASADLPESYPASDAGRITSGAAWALKARVELFNEKYADCIASCNNVIGKYSLFNSYEDLFRIQNENNSEIILDVEYLQDDQALW
ncbi:MAG TPA: RagB/SusD family nutrient uptake outer membrane protein, partial [Flavitalea sp.]|nr:RagB/SusD family nutrient uptake outer membrane protein [Flavitalea sp.]